MFRPTDSQRSLLECQFLMPQSKRARLEKSWAEVFRSRILPLIDEEVFRDAFSQDNGRPNKSLRLLTGLHLLKEWNDLTDEQVIDQLEYNLQWQYALGVTADDSHTCQKTLHNFRLLLLSDERAKKMLECVTRKLAESDDIDLSKQRLDSTHIISNMAVLTRLGLFTETVANFLRELQHHEGHLKQVSAEHVKRYLDREGYFADAKREEARRRLPVVAHDVLTLVRQFEGDKAISALVSFGLLQRLLMEQCEIVDGGDQDGGSFDNDADRSMGPKVEVQAPTTASPPTPPVEEPLEDGGQEASPNAQPEQSSSSSLQLTALSAVEEPCGSEDDEIEPKELLKDPSGISSSSLQSPHDPDATYGHKGKGYEAQVAESYDEGNPYQLITGVSINGANESDQHALIPMLDQLEGSGMSPEVLMADTGYGSGANIVESARRGVDLVAPVQDPNKSTNRAETRETTDDVAEGEAGQGPQPVDVVDTDGALAVLNIRGFDCEAFEFNATWDMVICCPGGAAPVRQNTNSQGDKFTAVFSAFDCSICALSELCPTRILASGERILQRAPSTAATKHRQHEQQSPAFKEHYKRRSGIESTNNELKGRHGAGNLRVRGRSRVELAMLLKALAVNTKRAVQYHTRRLIDATQDSVLQPA